MLDKLIEFLQKRLGQGVVGVVLLVVAGVLVAVYVPKWFLTTQTFSHEKENIMRSMSSGDLANSFKLNEIEMLRQQKQLMEMQNFIDQNQRGVCTDTQKMRIKKMEQEIDRLEVERRLIIENLRQEAK